MRRKHLCRPLLCELRLRSLIELNASDSVATPPPTKQKNVEAKPWRGGGLDNNGKPVERSSSFQMFFFFSRSPFESRGQGWFLVCAKTTQPTNPHVNRSTTRGPHWIDLFQWSSSSSRRTRQPAGWESDGIGTCLLDANVVGTEACAVAIAALSLVLGPGFWVRGTKDGIYVFVLTKSDLMAQRARIVITDCRTV